jgi:putative transposase
LRFPCSWAFPGATSNPTWGSKRIQAELAKLGIEVSDSTIRKYRPRTRRNDQTWKTFLHNHAKDLIAVDFFVVPTATFRVLYVFLVLAHERRKVLHFNITDSPSAAWTGTPVCRWPCAWLQLPTLSRSLVALWGNLLTVSTAGFAD